VGTFGGLGGRVLIITDVKIIPVRHENVEAFAHVTFDDSFIITRLKVVKRGGGYAVVMPGRYSVSSGKLHDICYPITKEMKEMIENKVLDAFEQV
jgi:stage V sporulation protein G